MSINVQKVAASVSKPSKRKSEIIEDHFPKNLLNIEALQALAAKERASTQYQQQIKAVDARVMDMMV